jgi:hypothetical protein
MPVSKKRGLAAISEEVWVGFAKQSLSSGIKAPPISLEDYAKNCGIEHVRFRQLIGDAGLAKRSDGFEIVVNTEAPGVSSRPETIASIGDGTWSKFPGSLRFTVAHEIAHAAFIKVASSRGEDNLLADHRSDVEEACKVLARVMLLPRHLLNRDLGERLLDLEHLHDLIKAFQVSPEVFIRRLHLSDWSPEGEKQDGFIALVQESESQLYFKVAYVTGEYATDRFNRAARRVNPNSLKKKYDYPDLSRIYRQSTWGLEGLAVNEAKLDRKQNIETALRSEEVGQIDIETGWGNDDIIPCRLSFRRLHEAPLGILISVKVAGPLQKPGQKTFF